MLPLVTDQCLLKSLLVSVMNNGQIILHDQGTKRLNFSAEGSSFGKLETLCASLKDSLSGLTSAAN